MNSDGLTTGGYGGDFAAGVDGMRDFKYVPFHHLRFHIAIPDARARLWDGLQYYMHERARWLPCYDDIADWLTDNHGKGIFCVGPCGLGKTLICQYILPVLINRYAQLVPSCYTAIEMAGQIDTILKNRERLVFIDDLGTEPAEVSAFGNRRVPFHELCDNFEREGNLLVVNTNLLDRMPRLAADGPLGRKGDPDPRRAPSIEERYGLRTLDRLRALTKFVRFKGESMRQ